MKCPRCSASMQATAIVKAGDETRRVTNHLCLSCFHRVIIEDKNPLLPIEYKQPTPVIVHNPHTNQKHHESEKRRRMHRIRKAYQDVVEGEPREERKIIPIALTADIPITAEPPQAQEGNGQ